VTVIGGTDDRPGWVDVRPDTDGNMVVEHADSTIAISLELLLAGESAGLTLDGNVIVFGGVARYRPVKWDLDMQALICWRVT
jgi:hypothetical protein